MIDFRYHLVSLISVFLALAVGIILGAGPLQGAIGQQLTDQVDALRTERNTLREEVEQARTTATEQREFIDAAGEQLVAGSLAGQSVAVVEVDDVGDDAVGAVLDELDAAGAQISAQESLTDSWTSAQDDTVRDTVADGLRDRLGQEGVGDVIDDESNSAELLAAALTLSLTDADPTDPTVRSSEAQDLQQLLERMGLVEVSAAPEGAADAILLLSGGAPDATEEQSEEADPETTGVAALTALAGTASDLTTTVVAGPTAQDGDLVSAVRSDDELLERVTTVSGIETRSGQIVVPLAVAAREDGVVDQYGFEEDASVLPPAPSAPSGPSASSGSAAGKDVAPSKGQGS